MTTSRRHRSSRRFASGRFPAIASKTSFDSPCVSGRLRTSSTRTFLDPFGNVTVDVNRNVLGMTFNTTAAVSAFAIGEGFAGDGPNAAHVNDGWCGGFGQVVLAQIVREQRQMKQSDGI